MHGIDILEFLKQKQSRNEKNRPYESLGTAEPTGEGVALRLHVFFVGPSEENATWVRNKLEPKATLEATARDLAGAQSRPGSYGQVGT
jgi:hypothetical protein